MIVHGGGKEITDLHSQLGVGFETVEGLRATSPESMRLVEMVLNGTVNTRLVRWLVNGGVDALGLSGVDMGLVRTTPLTVKGKSLGLVGQVGPVNGEALLQLLDLGLTPVISPVSLGEDGLAYNVNADHVAAGMAQAVEASKLIFVSNVPGVQVTGRTMRALTVAQIEGLIADGPYHRRHDPEGAFGHRGGGARGTPGGDHRPGGAGEGRGHSGGEGVTGEGGAGERESGGAGEWESGRMTMEIDLSLLPLCRKASRLAEIVTDLWADPNVVAIWLGGSLARGRGGSVQRCGLAGGVAADVYDPERIPAAAGRLSAAAVTRLRFHFGGEAVLWHMMLEDGTIYDLHLQPISRRSAARSPSDAGVPR